MTFEILLLILPIIAGTILAYLIKDKDIVLDRSIEDKLNELPSIYRNAKKSIKIATDFDARFFGNEEVKNALKEAIEDEVEVKILHERPAPEGYEGIGDKKPILLLKQHVMIIDGNVVRLEVPHEPCKFGEKEEDFAFIYKGFPELASKAEETFDRLWELQ